MFDIRKQNIAVNIKKKHDTIPVKNKIVQRTNYNNGNTILNIYINLKICKRFWGDAEIQKGSAA